MHRNKSQMQPGKYKPQWPPELQGTCPDSRKEFLYTHLPTLSFFCYLSFQPKTPIDYNNWLWDNITTFQFTPLGTKAFALSHWATSFWGKVCKFGLIFFFPFFFFFYEFLERKSCHGFFFLFHIHKVIFNFLACKGIDQLGF